MSSWNNKPGAGAVSSSHGEVTGAQAVPTSIPNYPQPPQMMAASGSDTRSARRSGPTTPRSTSSGEDGEIGEEEGEIVIGTDVDNNMNHNNNNASISVPISTNSVGGAITNTLNYSSNLRGNINSGTTSPNPLSARSISAGGASGSSEHEATLAGGMTDRPAIFARGSAHGSAVPPFSRRSGSTTPWGSSNVGHNGGHRGGGRGGPPYGSRGMSRPSTGNRSFSGPLGNQHQSSMTANQQNPHQHSQLQPPPPPPPPPSVSKPEFVQRAQTFSGFSSSTSNASNSSSFVNRMFSNEIPKASQNQLYHTSQSQNQSQSTATSTSGNVAQNGRGFSNTASTSSRPTDPRFRGGDSGISDPRFRATDYTSSDARFVGNTAAEPRFRGAEPAVSSLQSTSRFSSAAEVGNSATNSSNLTSLSSGRGIQHNMSQPPPQYKQQHQTQSSSSVPHLYSSGKDVNLESSSTRESTNVRREVSIGNRTSFGVVTDSNDSVDGSRSNLGFHRHEGTSRFSRSNDVEFTPVGKTNISGTESGVSYSSPRRPSTSRIPKSDLFSRGGSSGPTLGDEDEEARLHASSVSRSSRENIGTFRSSSIASKDTVSDAGYSTRPRTPSTTRELSRSESSGGYDGGIHSTHTSRPTSRDVSSSSFRVGPPPLTDSSLKDYGGQDPVTSNAASSTSSKFGLRGPLISQRDSYRGTQNRRGTDFGNSSSTRGYGIEDTAYRSSNSLGDNIELPSSSLRATSSSDVGDSYYNSSLSTSINNTAEFRRSPAPRRSAFGLGRDNSTGVLPAPPLGRSTHRRTDPRFIPANADQDTQTTGFGKSSSDGPPPPPGAFSANTGGSDDVSKQQSFAKLAEGDPFGRTREWSSTSSSSMRRSPQSSPMNRRTSLTYLHTSPGERPKLAAPSLITVAQTAANVPLANDFSSMSFSTLPSTPRTPTYPKPEISNTAVTSFPSSTKEVDNVNDQSNLARPSLPSSQEDTAPPPLLTSALGASNVTRGEYVISEVADLLSCSDLKPSNIGELSRLPSKNQILKAVTLMETKVKSSQRSIENLKSELESATKEEESIRQKAREEAVSQAKRQEDERLRREEEHRSKEVSTLEIELEAISARHLAEQEKQKIHSLVELEKELVASKDVEEHKVKDSLNQQMLSTADDFDKNIEKVKKDIEKIKQSALKTEAKLTTSESEYKTKVEDIERSGAVEPDDIPDDFISSILAENRRRAAEAHIFSFASDMECTNDDSITDVMEELQNIKDPRESRTSAAWAQMTLQVTGPENALYTEPNQAPYYEHNEQRHAAMEPYISEYIKETGRALTENWTSLAEEYEYRRSIYDKSTPLRDKKSMKSSNFIERYSTLGPKTVQTVLESNGGRTNSNPYRRARRGNEVRSESELEQVIAELAETEAMQKRITCGGCTVPRQRTRVEKLLTVAYVNTFVAQKVDMVKQEDDLAMTNLWTDMEKCIFLDRFMQHPKDFRKIASFLRNKTTSDCVRFYYDSKQSVPYKQALREHIMRRKRRGDYHIWDATVEAALSTGSTIHAGVNEEKPLVFKLPESDLSYFTQKFHPFRRSMYDNIDVSNNALANYNESVSDDDEPKKQARTRKRPREALFVLDVVHKKFLKNQDTPSPVLTKKTSLFVETADPDLVECSNNVTVSLSSNTLQNESDGKGDPSMTPFRKAPKAPQKWTAEEKKIFIDTLAIHGRNWTMLSQAVGTKSTSQIKNYYYDYKKQSGKGRIEKKSSKKEGSTTGSVSENKDSKSRDEETMTPPLPTSRTSTPPETPMEESISRTDSYESKARSFSGDATVVASNLMLSLAKGSTNLTSMERNSAARFESRSSEVGPAEARLMKHESQEQRLHEQRVMDQRAVGTIQQRSSEVSHYDSRSAEQRMMEARTAALRAMERTSTDPRLHVQELRSGERNIHASGARDSSGYGWSSNNTMGHLLMQMQQQSHVPSHHQPQHLHAQHLHQQHYHHQQSIPQLNSQLLQHRQLAPQQQIQQIRHGPPHAQGQNTSRHQLPQLHQQHQSQQDHQRQMPLPNAVGNLGNPNINFLTALAQPPRNQADEMQIALTQRLLGLLGDGTGNDALSVLARLDPGNFHGQGNHGNR